jgi:hypothetical protein
MMMMMIPTAMLHKRLMHANASMVPSLMEFGQSRVVIHPSIHPSLSLPTSDAAYRVCLPDRGVWTCRHITTNKSLTST